MWGGGEGEDEREEGDVALQELAQDAGVEEEEYEVIVCVLVFVLVSVCVYSGSHGLVFFNFEFREGCRSKPKLWGRGRAER